MQDPFGKFHKLRLGAKCDEDYDEALRELKKIEEQRTLPVNILVLKGMCIQLGSEKCPYALADAEAAFKSALEVDGDYFDALIELAAFYNTTQGQAEKALPFYEKALQLARSQLTEAIQGYAECCSEVRSADEALALIDQFLGEPVDRERIDKTIASIKKFM